jgi:hypothetical protein
MARKTSRQNNACYPYPERDRQTDRQSMKSLANVYPSPAQAST